MFLVPPAVGFPRRQTARVVRVGLEGRELCQRVNAAFKGNLRRGKQLVVFLNQIVFPLHFWNNVGRECLFLDFCVDKQNVAVLGREVRAEGRSQHGFQPCLLVFLQLRLEAVPECLLAVVEFVAGVDGMAHLRKGGQRVDFLFLFRKAAFEYPYFFQ